MATKNRYKRTRKQEYEQAYNRMLRRVKEYEKQGYLFDRASLPKKTDKPNIKSIQKVESYRSKKLLSLASYYDPVENRLVTAEEEQKLRRSRAAKKGWETRRKKKEKERKSRPATPPTGSTLILDTVLDMIDNWSPKEQWNSKGKHKRTFADVKRDDVVNFKTILGYAIQDIGREQVARNLEYNASRVLELAERILYGYSGSNKDAAVQADITAISQIAIGRILNQFESERFENPDFGEEYLDDGEEE